MNRATLDLHGITTVPLRRVAQDVLLEGWLHYEDASYRYYRWHQGPVQIELRHRDASGVAQNVAPLKAVSSPGLPAHEFGFDSDRKPPAMPAEWLTDHAVFKKAAMIHCDGTVWKYKVFPHTNVLEPVEGSAESRIGAILVADGIMSKFLVQDVHDDPVDLRGIAHEIDSLRTVLSAFVWEERHRDVEAGDDATIRVRGSTVHQALRLLGIQPVPARKHG